MVAGIIAAAAWPMAHAYHQPDLLPILLIIATGYLFIPLAVVPMALLARTMSFHGHFMINVGGALAQGVVALTLAWAGFSAFALAWATLASGVTRGVIAQILRPALPWPLRLDNIGPILNTGSRLTTIYATGALGTRTPDMVVGKLVTLLAVGLYSRAVSLSDQFRMLIAGAISSVFFPAFARIRDRGEPLGPAYLRVCAGYSAVVWPGMAGLALAAQPIVRILYGPEWMKTAPLLSYIALSDIILIALPMVSDLPILLGRINKLLVFNLIDTAISLVLLTLGCMMAGVMGAAVSRLVYAVFWLCLYFRFIHGMVQFDLRQMLAIYLRSALVTCAAIAPLALSYLFWAPPATITLLQLAVSVATGCLAWLSALAILRHPALDELLGIAASLPLPRIFRRTATV